MDMGIVNAGAMPLYDSIPTNEKSLTANATFSFHKANSNSVDDILVYDENGNHIKNLHGLRQQALKDSSDINYYCISDFIAPVESNLVDYIGNFVVTIQGVENLFLNITLKP